MNAPAALVLRPEPGNAATCARLAAAGIVPHPLPLFAARPLAWSPPAPAAYDAVLFTSANAPRLAGTPLRALTRLPALAVGAATAAAVRAAGFAVALTGTSDAAHLLEDARAAGFHRPLHLAGREHHATGATTIPVYATDPVPLTPRALAAAIKAAPIALLHSPRAAAHFAMAIDAAGIDRSRVGIAALSPAVLAAAGGDWAWTACPDTPDDAALVRLVAARACRDD